MLCVKSGIYIDLLEFAVFGRHRYLENSIFRKFVMNSVFPKDNSKVKWTLVPYPRIHCCLNICITDLAFSLHRTCMLTII